jgi:hypothetical protein
LRYNLGVVTLLIYIHPVARLQEVYVDYTWVNNVTKSTI